MLGRKWMFVEEPTLSDTAIIFMRITGIIIIFLSVVMFIKVL